MALGAVVDLTLSTKSAVSITVFVAKTTYTKLFFLNQTSSILHWIVPEALAGHQPMVFSTSKTATPSSLLLTGSPMRSWPSSFRRYLMGPTRPLLRFFSYFCLSRVSMLDLASARSKSQYANSFRVLNSSLPCRDLSQVSCSSCGILLHTSSMISVGFISPGW